MIETVLGKKERGTRRKEGRGGRNDEKEGATRRKESEKIKKVAKQRTDGE